MPRDIALACKKRQHPDGCHLSASTPKRLLSISEAELGSSIDLANDPNIPTGSTFDTAHGSLWNSASSAVITSDCSTSMCAGNSTLSANVVSSKPPSFGFALAHTPSDASRYNLEASKSARDLPSEGKCKGIWRYRSSASEREGTISGEECSEVTYVRTSISTRAPEGVFASGKARHIISRREKSSLNSKRGMDEAWLNNAFGYEESLLRAKRLESNSSLQDTNQREYTYSSMACDDSGSSCATGDSLMEEIRSKQRLSHIYGSVCQEPFVASPNARTRAQVLVGPGAQKRSGDSDHSNTQEHLASEVDLHSSLGKTEELSPAYVLSSGRLSLEEEARLGRRAPTIDQDFEEYFSSLML